MKAGRDSGLGARGSGLGNTAFWAAATALAAIAIYWPARHAGFVGDDFMILHRLRDLAGVPDAIRFFGAEFFEYYRPLGFVSHAIDWSIAGADARQFHLTNLLLHGANAVLVLLVARAIEPRFPAAPLAALLFALHASNHEAVVWISARFDLLATFWSLAAIAWMASGARGWRAGAPCLYFLALLSKESVVALPIAVAAWAVFIHRATTKEAALTVAPWVAALGGYAVLRQAAAGVSAMGGAARAPKLLAFAAILTLVLLCADGRWLAWREAIRRRWHAIAWTAVACLAALVLLSAMTAGRASELAREKLEVAGFALLYLIAPVTNVGTADNRLQSLDAIYWWIAAAGLPALLLVFVLGGRRVIDDGRTWFLAALVVATLLPISALTEGRRYLYLPSAAVSIAVGVLVANLRGRTRTVAIGAAAVLLAVSGWAIGAKVQDWIWAGRMTAEGARLADEAVAPACNDGTIVFLTSPVGVRGVYTHFYYETFEPVRGCIPEAFHVVARLVRLDTQVEARWAGPDRIEVTIPNYRDNVVLSADLRQFDRPLRRGAREVLQTPPGEIQAEVDGTLARLTLSLDRAGPGTAPALLYYSNGQIWRLAENPSGRAALEHFRGLFRGIGFDSRVAAGYPILRSLRGR